MEKIGAESDNVRRFLPERRLMVASRQKVQWQERS